jgi:protein involved in polysaccharide export with SLBB domain
VIVLKGEPVSCLQAVINAGGPKSSAGLQNAVLLRYAGDQTATVRRLNLKRVMEGLDPDIRLRPYDVVLIPRSKIGKVNLFVEQYVNGLLPKNIVFPYNLNTSFSIE